MEWAEIQFEVMVPDADESFDAADTPAMIAAGIAIRKNKATQAHKLLGTYICGHLPQHVQYIFVANLEKHHFRLVPYPQKR